MANALINRLIRVRDDLKCAVNMGGTQHSAAWAVPELSSILIELEGALAPELAAQYTVERTGNKVNPYCVVDGSNGQQLFSGQQRTCVKLAGELAKAFEAGRAYRGGS